MTKKKIGIIIGVVVLLAAGVFFYLRYRAAQTQSAALSKYQTAIVEKGTLTATVGANGNVRARQSAVINWLTSGKVDVVKVEVGEAVKEDQELAELDKSNWSQAILQSQNDLINAKQALQDLYDNYAKNSAQAVSDMVTAQDDYDQAVRNRDGMNGLTRGTQETIDKYQADYALAKEQQKQAQENFNTVAGMAVDDPTRAQALRSLSNSNSALVTALINYNYYSGKPDAQDIQLADATLALEKSKLDAAKRKVEELKNGPRAQDIELAQGKIEISQVTLTQTKLTAPFDGVITEVGIKPGDMVTAGSLGFRIHDLSKLYVDLQVSEIDINRVKIGDKVSITFDAVSEDEYQGKVSEVGMVGTNTSGAIYYNVTVELTDADTQVKSGMTAAANIIVSEIENVLLVPNLAVQLVKEKRVVYLLQPDGSLKSVDIELGASSDEMSELVTGDIKAGDTIVLNPPAENAFGPGGGGPPPGMD